MTCLRLAIWPASTPRTPGVAFSDATRSGIPPCGGACASASRAPGLKIAAASAAAKTSSRTKRRLLKAKHAYFMKGSLTRRRARRMCRTSPWRSMTSGTRAAAIRVVAGGDSLIRPAITERVLRGLEHVRRDFDALSPPDPLTKRELEILRLMAGGYSNREISEALGTAEGTVKNHASSILSKLGVRDRTRAVLKALELGYI